MTIFINKNGDAVDLEHEALRLASDPLYQLTPEERLGRLRELEAKFEKARRLVDDAEAILAVRVPSREERAKLLRKLREIFPKEPRGG